MWALELPPGREAGALALLFFTGLRASAPCGILVGNISENPPAIATTTKGNRTVMQTMHPKLAELVFNDVLTEPT